jgi:nicotinamidase/pyrazinamidase
MRGGREALSIDGDRRGTRFETRTNGGFMAEPLVFFDVDTQADFMLPTGSLYVPGAQEIVPNLKMLTDFARAHGIPVVSSADAHSPDDKSFAEWPPHCVVGTPGQLRIPETSFPSSIIIANRPGRFDAPSKWSGQIIIEKQEYDATTNVNFDAILKALGMRRAVVFGVATEYCVRGTALGLRKRGLQVDLVTDAIKAIKPRDGRKAIEEMVAAGVHLVETAAVCVPAKP